MVGRIFRDKTENKILWDPNGGSGRYSEFKRLISKKYFG
jgi:hypothetical protein